MNALKYFRGADRLNCAQSIVKAFQREDLLSEMSANGGGNADQGICGALHAAIELVPEEHRKTMLKAFYEKTGAITCRQLKMKRVSCTRCVQLAEDLLSQYKELAIPVGCANTSNMKVSEFQV